MLDKLPIVHIESNSVYYTVYINGVEIPCVQSVKYEQSVEKFGFVTLKIAANVVFEERKTGV